MSGLEESFLVIPDELRDEEAEELVDDVSLFAAAEEIIQLNLKAALRELV